jgi:hypothetical protein
MALLGLFVILSIKNIELELISWTWGLFYGFARVKL